MLVSLESAVGDRRRIDVEVGSTVIEVKRDLRREKPKREAEEQLSGYVEFRTKQTGQRYVGVLTDGTEWACYNLVDGKLREVSSVVLDDVPNDIERLVVWLEDVLATASNLAPTAQNIEARLGARSSSYALDRATLSALYQRNRNSPTVRMKRTLWSRLLTVSRFSRRRPPYGFDFRTLSAFAACTIPRLYVCGKAGVFQAW